MARRSGVETDLLLRIDEQVRVAEAFTRAASDLRLERVESAAGHDALLASTEPFETAVWGFLTERHWRRCSASQLQLAALADSRFGLILPAL